jgi:alpha-glucosidase
MSQQNNSQAVYKFVKVEDFFANYKTWQKLEKVNSHEFNATTKTLTLEFAKPDGDFCVMMIQFVQKDTFRVRFNPGKSSAPQYSAANSSAVYMSKFDDLRTALETDEPFDVEDCTQDPRERIDLLIRKASDRQAVLRLVVNYAPFQITVFNCEMDGPELKVWETAPAAVYFAANGSEDYAIIQAVNKPATARYLGFGEQGGQALCKNTAQVTYFNYDNMRYRQVYNYGPLDGREPLYHSDPFFVEFNSIPDKDCVTAIFIDNPSQVCVDVGYLNSGRYMFGTRFGDLDYYFFIGDEFAEIVDSFTSIVGRSKLKPRYALGYHQGCYGYEDRGALEWVVNKYRDYGIPLDGLHVDVDVQNNYRTFTIDESKFPNPQEMFANLRAKGIKCSTNITPIISNQDKYHPDYYNTYKEGLEKGYFVLDIRQDPDHPESKKYQDFNSGWESYYDFTDPEGNFNSGDPYIGEVYYGQDYTNGRSLGTTGHYPDLAREEVRQWWGQQYQYLFDMGLEFVWQDMTTPAIRPTRGDMRSFPFNLLINDDFYADIPAGQSHRTPAIKVWNLFSYNLHKATYYGLDRLPGRENKRNFIVGRGSFAGMHRYAALWTGDNSSTWDFLKMNVSQALSLGMCGMVLSGQDIGGFEAEDDEQHWVGPELLIRWTAAGTFLPWFRNHYMRKGRKYFQEPFMYEEWFNEYRGGNIPEPQNLYRSVLPICKYYIELRYRLLQLFYDAMFENSLNGQPICRPMFLTDPDDKALYNDKRSFLDTQFLVRGDLLVAPVLEPQSASNGNGRREVYLPAGSDWYCFMNNRQPLAPVTEGGTTINFDAHIDASNDHINFVVPMYVRAGAIIPTIEVEQYVGERNAKGLVNPITLNVYPGTAKNIPDGDRTALKVQQFFGLPKTPQKPYTMYLDDGASRSSVATKKSQPCAFGVDPEAKDEYRQVEITNYPPEQADKIRVITVERRWDNYTPKFETYFFVAVLHDLIETKGSSGPLKSIKISRGTTDAQVIPFITGNTSEQSAASLNESANDAWYYNEDINISFIKVFDNNPSITIMAEYL